MIARRLAASVLLAACAAAGAATPSSRGFVVTVDFLNIVNKTVACKRSVFPGSSEGAKVDVACSTVPPQENSPTRFMLQVLGSQNRITTVDSEMEAGTVTSWRVVQLPNREYVEMTVGW
jgi:hypothetical protein